MGSPEVLLAAGGAAAAVLLAVIGLLLRKRKRPAATPLAAPPKAGAFDRVSGDLWSRLRGILGGESAPDAQIDAIEEVLITSDVGVRATQRLLDRLRQRLGSDRDEAALRAALREEILSLLGTAEPAVIAGKPHVIAVIGVNGVGKTTTIAKLAKHFLDQDKKVLLVAGDTFRAAASEQLATWAERLGIDCIRQDSGSSPAAVAFDGIKAAIAREVDVAIVDTAGRLHVKENLVQELQKMMRVIDRECPGAPHEIFLVIDATTGQNAVSQAKVFKEAIPLTGIVLTKMDGTAKGGAVLAVRTEVDLPVRYVGFGEQPGDFAAFDPERFADALLKE